MANASVVHRLDLGYFVRSAAEAGGPHPRVEPVLAHLVCTGGELILFDTGIGAGHDGVEARYRPRRRPLAAALGAVGVRPQDVSLVVNCHLHFDHSGGNPLFPGVPLLVQRVELATARRGDYTLDHLVDFPGARYEELDGEAEIRPGVRVVPTPGHTDGHQSLVVDRPGGALVLAGQAYDTAADFGAADLARRAAREGVAQPLPPYPVWVERLAGFAPARVLFAHDCAVWEPSGH